jgi:uncharacterized lipoprotein YmbA
MMRHVPLLCAVMPILAMCGCRSTPIAYYTLTPASHGGAPIDNGRPAVTTVLVVRSLPAGIDTTQILIRTDGARLRVDEGGRWVAPLGDELRGALVNALRNQYGIMVLDSVRHKDAPVPRIDLAVRRFDFVEGGSVTLAVDWVLSNPGAEPGASLSCQAEFTEASTATVGGAVAAGQAAALKLARVLGAAVEAASNGATPTC